MKNLWIFGLLIFVSCTNSNDGRGRVRIDGSSTVFPISEAIAEEFRKSFPRVRVTIRSSGTGAGFKSFIRGETDINDASRSIKPSEIAKAQKKDIRYIEIPVAYDGISVVVHPQNDWVDHLTVQELKKIWEPSSQVTQWSDVRDGWPEKEIKLYGPGTDSGTFDYFTTVINGKAHASRSNFTKSEDDNMLVKGVSGDRYSLGFFGYAYYANNKDKIKAVPIENGKGPVVPTLETIKNGTYAPLSRPVYIYVNVASGKRPAVQQFVDFYLKQASSLVTEVGYVPLKTSEYKEQLNLFSQSVGMKEKSNL